MAMIIVCGGITAANIYFGVHNNELWSIASFVAKQSETWNAEIGNETK